MNYEFSKHANSVIKEREIKLHWIENTIENYDLKEKREDNNVHYFKKIKERIINHAVAFMVMLDLAQQKWEDIQTNETEQPNQVHSKDKG
jgi:hypothetical protein